MPPLISGFVVAKVNKWDEFTLLDHTLHPDAGTARQYVIDQNPKFGEAILADYKIIQVKEW